MNKACSKCAQIKPLIDYDRRRNRKSGMAHASECKTCRAHYARERYRRDREKIIAKQRFYVHGVEQHQYEQMLRDQRAVCMICGRPETLVRYGRVQSLSVDHNHDTGEIRDLLCSSCNVMIGYSRESPDILRKAAEYIERHSIRKAA